MKFTCINCGRMAFNIQCRMCFERSRELASEARRKRRKMLLMIASVAIGLAVGFVVGLA